MGKKKKTHVKPKKKEKKGNKCGERPKKVKKTCGAPPSGGARIFEMRGQITNQYYITFQSDFSFNLIELHDLKL